jgi:predicted permease
MEWGDLLFRYLPVIARLFVIIFCTLGAVYYTGRLLFPKLKDKGKNLIAAFFLPVFSILFNLVYSYPGVLNPEIDMSAMQNQVILSTVGYMCGATVGYIVLGWKFYPRMDAWLDKKIGPDKKRKK